MVFITDLCLSDNPYGFFHESSCLYKNITIPIFTMVCVFLIPIWIIPFIIYMIYDSCECKKAEEWSNKKRRENYIPIKEENNNNDIIVNT